jgi:hypothetical protein
MNLAVACHQVSLTLMGKQVVWSWSNVSEEFLHKKMFQKKSKCFRRNPNISEEI